MFGLKTTGASKGHSARFHRSPGARPYGSKTPAWRDLREERGQLQIAIDGIVIADHRLAVDVDRQAGFGSALATATCDTASPSNTIGVHKVREGPVAVGQEKVDVRLLFRVKAQQGHLACVAGELLERPSHLAANTVAIVKLATPCASHVRSPRFVNRQLQVCEAATLVAMFDDLVLAPASLPVVVVKLIPGVFGTVFAGSQCERVRIAVGIHGQDIAGAAGAVVPTRGITVGVARVALEVDAAYQWTISRQDPARPEGKVSLIQPLAVRLVYLTGSLAVARR